MTNPNYNTMPEQVNQNTKDIAILKNTVKTPAIIYNATVEMSQDAGVINQSNITQQVTTTANAFVLDTVGKLFRIVTVENDQVYVEYCAKITGPQGTPGADGVGIQSITSITPTQDNGYTVTPVTFTDTNGNQTTLNVRAKNGEYAQVDNTFSATSENPVQNKIIYNKVVPSEYITATKNADVVQNGSCQYKKTGNLVVVKLQQLVLKTGTASHDAMVFSGLPTTDSEFIFIVPSYNDTEDSSLRLRISCGGNIYTNYTKTSSFGDTTNEHDLVFCYMSNE